MNSTHDTWNVQLDPNPPAAGFPPRRIGSRRIGSRRIGFWAVLETLRNTGVRVEELVEFRRIPHLGDVKAGPGENGLPQTR